MSFSMLIVTLILTGLGTIAGLILSIVFFATSKNRHALISTVLFIMMFASVILCLMEITERVKRAADDFSNVIHDGADSLKNKLSRWGDSLDVTIKNYHSPLHDSLVSYIDPGLRDSVSRKFWDNEDDGNTLLPLIYPYQLKAEEGLHEGAKLVCFNDKNCKLSNAGIKLNNITELNLDKYFILLKKDNSLSTGKNENENEPDAVYILFNSKTGSAKTFLNEKQLMREAEKVGFRGEKELMSLSVYYDRL